MITDERMQELKALCKVIENNFDAEVIDALPELLTEVDQLRTRNADLLKLAEDAVERAKWASYPDDPRVIDLKRRFDGLKGTVEL